MNINTLYLVQNELPFCAIEAFDSKRICIKSNYVIHEMCRPCSFVLCSVCCVVLCCDLKTRVSKR